MPRQTKVLLVALSIAVAACAGDGVDQQPSALDEIADIGELATEFNESSGTPRLILLLSPT